MEVRKHDMDSSEKSVSLSYMFRVEMQYIPNTVKIVDD